MLWEFEWGSQLETLEAVRDMTGGKITPAPLLNRPRIFLHLLDIVEAISICESRGNQFSARTPVAEISAYYSTFSTFDGSASDFLRLYRHVEDLKAAKREEQNVNK